MACVCELNENPNLHKKKKILIFFFLKIGIFFKIGKKITKISLEMGLRTQKKPCKLKRFWWDCAGWLESLLIVYAISTINLRPGLYMYYHSVRQWSCLNALYSLKMSIFHLTQIIIYFIHMIVNYSKTSKIWPLICQNTRLFEINLGHTGFR